MKKNFKEYFDLSDKVAIVTGGRRGMGRTHCLALSDAGAKIVVSDISLPECKMVVEEIRERGGEAIAVECDISKKSEVEDLIKVTKDNYGRIDILVNNAGVVDFKNFFDLQEEDWDRVLNINLKGYFFCSQLAAEVMKETGGGSIVNIGSIAMGQTGIGFSNTAPYVSSKGGIAGLTEAMAIDLANYNIRVNLIAPGVIETPMIDSIKENKEALEQIINRLPLKRLGKPEEISTVVLFLASDASLYMTGSVINVDGGWLTT
jgi:2-dehydro-3-deoxy-D-gluconate 5-dehydrogenase